VEKPGFGHSACFAPIVFEGTALSGSIISVTIAGTDGTRLTGRQHESAAA